MRSWWGRSSKDVKEKSIGESIFGSYKKCISSGTPRRRRSDTHLEKESQSRADSESPPPSKHVSRSQSFGGRPQAQPLPLPSSRSANIGDDGPENNRASIIPSLGKGSKNLPKPRRVKVGSQSVDGEGDLAAAFNSSGSSSDTDDPSESRLVSPQASDYENNGIKSAAASPSGLKQRDQCPFADKKKPREITKPADDSLNGQKPARPKKAPLNSNLAYLKIPRPRNFLSAPDSSMSSPSRSPMRVVSQEPHTDTNICLGKPYADLNLLGSGQCSSPGSGHNSVAGDYYLCQQMLWPQSRCSPECSPLPSPRMTSPGPSSRVHSGAVTPMHPHSPTCRHDDGKQQSHRLPLPPVTTSNPPPFNSSYSTGTSPRIPRSPGKTDNPPSPCSRWKKGRLLGRGTFGHVYLGFSSESGEMCAMKEVTLFSDDTKSKESAQQLGQEIAMLSRLRHPNIVQYYGSDNFDDKLYIYLEYVSGGSIYKILQEYGQLGEAAIRSYTRQILSGLAYLHAKNTLHRDIKGANILVDPNGRVKLADFGMAKHITGPSCPLSLKGSPYWMAPEVIRNTNGYNLAVDIWSLGCTVLEMATTKPPWSQYEGVAAMFKIGNSRELPAIPDHLSDDGKDFVRQCLQRNPRDRPTAAQLLEHPFVKNIASSKRFTSIAEPKEATSSVTHAVRTLRLGNSSGDAYTARNVSGPVSPIGSPLSHPLSPQHISGRITPSPISSPRSGTSTPLVIDNTTLPSYCHLQSTNYVQEGMGMVSRSQNTFHQNGNSSREQKPDIFRGIVQAHLSMETTASRDNMFSGNKIEKRPASGDLYDAHLILANRVSQQLLRNPVRLNSPVLDLNQHSSTPKRTTGF